MGRVARMVTGALFLLLVSAAGAAADPGPTTTILSGPSGETSSTTATFTFTASVPDATFECELDGGSDVECSSPTTYTGLKAGQHRFRIRARAHGDRGPRVERTWTVKPDTTPPVLTTPPNAAVEADGPAGTRVTFTVTATDGDSPLPASAVSCSPGSGSTFPLGSTTVQCTATDAAGNSGKGSFAVTVHDTTPPAINAPDVSVTATRAGGTRRTDAALAAYLAGVSATDLVSTPTVTNDAPEFLPVGRTEITFRARDAAGNTSSKQATVTVLRVGRFARPIDVTPPGTVRRAQAVAGDHLVRLSWLAPLRDFHHVTVTRTALGVRSPAQVVYRGPGRRHVDRRLSNGVLYRYLIVAFDRAGNRSRGVVVTAKPQAVLLAAPRSGQRITAPPLLRWVPVPAASYFNMQLWRGSQKLLSAWPAAARYQLPRSWTYADQVHRLVPGVYTWYVWPGIGTRAAARYGPMLGKSTFVVLPPQ